MAEINSIYENTFPSGGKEWKELVKITLTEEAVEIAHELTQKELEAMNNADGIVIALRMKKTDGFTNGQLACGIHRQSWYGYYLSVYKSACQVNGTEQIYRFVA